MTKEGTIRMKEEWERFKGWLGKNFQEGLDDLNEPVSDEKISDLESKLSISLPEDFKEFLKIHNGQAGDAGWLIDGQELLSTERILDEWKVWKGLLDGGGFDDFEESEEEDRGNGVKSDWWNAKWIPFTYDGAGNHLCIDLDPASGGKIGQIITMWHDDDEREVKGSSFNEWFSKYIQDLENKKYVYSDEYEAIVSVDDI